MARVLKPQFLSEEGESRSDIRSGYRRRKDARGLVGNRTTWNRCRHASIFDSSNSFSAFNSEAEKDALEAFLASVAGSMKVHNPGLWLNAAAYLCWMNKKPAMAEQFLAKLGSMKDLDERNRSQMSVTNALLQFIKVDAMTVAGKEQLYVMLDPLMNPHQTQGSGMVSSYILSTLAEEYKKQGNLLLAELCANNGKDYYNEESQYDEMLNFMRNPGHTHFEQLLLRRYRISRANIIEYKAA